MFLEHYKIRMTNLTPPAWRARLVALSYRSTGWGTGGAGTCMTFISCSDTFTSADVSRSEQPEMSGLEHAGLYGSLSWFCSFGSHKIFFQQTMHLFLFLYFIIPSYKVNAEYPVSHESITSVFSLTENVRNNPALLCCWPLHAQLMITHCSFIVIVIQKKYELILRLPCSLGCHKLIVFLSFT